MNIDTAPLDKLLGKLSHKDHVLFMAVQKKINQIGKLDRATIGYIKNLRLDLREYKGVHVGSFVLMFKVKGDTVIFTSFGHHDNAYKKRG